jgi:hypothetical protein
VLRGGLIGVRVDLQRGAYAHMPKDRMRITRRHFQVLDKPAVIGGSGCCLNFPRAANLVALRVGAMAEYMLASLGVPATGAVAD